MALEWLPPPADIALENGAVHLWRVPLQVQPDELAVLYQTLSTDEQERARRFLSPDAAQRFVVARARLRHLLAQYCRVDAARLCFRYSTAGKPALASIPGQVTPQFNLSHSHDTALIAVVAEAAIGVDLEYIARVVDSNVIARRFFLPTETAFLATLPEPERRQTFFTYWTIKEAYYKALGHNLLTPLTDQPLPIHADRSDFVPIPGLDSPVRIVSLFDGPWACALVLVPSQPAPYTLRLFSFDG